MLSGGSRSGGAEGKSIPQCPTLVPYHNQCPPEGKAPHPTLTLTAVLILRWGVSLIAHAHVGAIHVLARPVGQAQAGVQCTLIDIWGRPVGDRGRKCAMPRLLHNHTCAHSQIHTHPCHTPVPHVCHPAVHKLTLTDNHTQLYACTYTEACTHSFSSVARSLRHTCMGLCRALCSSTHSVPHTHPVLALTRGRPSLQPIRLTLGHEAFLKPRVSCAFIPRHAQTFLPAPCVPCPCVATRSGSHLVQHTALTVSRYRVRNARLLTRRAHAHPDAQLLCAPPATSPWHLLPFTSLYPAWQRQR